MAEIRTLKEVAEEHEGEGICLAVLVGKELKMGDNYVGEIIKADGRNLIVKDGKSAPIIITPDARGAYEFL